MSERKPMTRMALRSVRIRRSVVGRARRARALLAALVLVLGAAAAGCWEQKVWSGAAEFVGRLHCGMSQPEAERTAKTYRGLKLEVQEADSLVFWKGSTMIELGFESNRLRRAQVSWIDTIMHVTSLPEVNLCEPMSP